MIKQKKKLRLSGKKTYKLLLDILLFVIFIFLCSPLIAGLSAHEMLGVLYFLPVIFHLLFSWTWIKQSSKRFFCHSSWRSRFIYVLNTGLFISIVLEIISGLAIPQVILPYVRIKTFNNIAWADLHKQVFAGIVLLLSCHIALNWQAIVIYFKKHAKRPAIENKDRLYSGPLVKRKLQQVFIIILAAGMITVIAFFFVGTSGGASPNFKNDITRFKPNFLIGILQISGAVITITILSCIARLFLKIRL